MVSMTLSFAGGALASLWNSGAATGLSLAQTGHASRTRRSSVTTAHAGQSLGGRAAGAPRSPPHA
eukprot:7404554-Alexandrium_andersonii.AAC.1